MTSLLWASEGGHAHTVRVLVELGASVEAVDKVNIHACMCLYMRVLTGVYVFVRVLSLI